ncbi:sensor histidine kinase [Actinomadura namibiensis]|uniref:histidine kinase n=1 Tax=Actinomadura namibiensis TaxID=182080 RepID=A0A7W3LZA2_ACTNM|nr:sensor histidine kinase [Actinomadura namibiensis]MBA8957093.1 signal transduction histidine kinase [Actinomadura namibiensis]
MVVGSRALPPSAPRRTAVTRRRAGALVTALTPERRARAADAALALLMLAVLLDIVVKRWPDGPVPLALPAGLLLGLAQVGVVLVRRTRPLLTLTVIVAADLTGWLLLPELPFDPLSLGSLVALYAVGRYLPYRTGWWSGLAATGAGAVAYAVHSPTDMANAVAALLALVLGQYTRLRAETAERRRAERAAEAVRAERRHIARELHDVVAHHISVMSVLVGAARTTMAADPERAAEALVTTERTAREAMAEMRRLLAVLRADDEPEPDARADRLPALVERARAAGVRADLRVEGRARPLPPAADLAVYRTVQEALTNAQKHAAGARVRVVLRYTDTAVEAEVHDDGSGGPAPAPAPADRPGHGHGLRGMAERVALCGGDLAAGPAPGGGFRVRARLPLPPDALPQEAT